MQLLGQLRIGRDQVGPDRHHVETTGTLRNRFTLATVSARRLRVSAQTIRNRLRQDRAPIHARRHYKGQILTARHRAARLAWARRHRHWIRAQWRNVIFTDESCFRVSFADGRVWVW